MAHPKAHALHEIERNSVSNDRFVQLAGCETRDNVIIPTIIYTGIPYILIGGDVRISYVAVGVIILKVTLAAAALSASSEFFKK